MLSLLTGWVLHIFVVQSRFEVGQRSVQPGRKAHHFETLIHKSLLVQLLENPPYRLHEPRVQGLVVVLEVDPPTKPCDDVLQD